MKIFKTITTIAIIIGLAGFMFMKLSANKAIIDEKAQPKEEVINAIPVRVAVVDRQSVDNSLLLTGSFEARKELNIIAEAQGRLTSLSIDEGSSVGKGQVVAKIDDTGIRSQLATANASKDKAQKDVERFERLVKAGAVSQLQVEEMRLNPQNTQTNVTAVEQQLKYTTVKSPMTGIVKEVKVEEGSFATPGAVIATVVDVSRLKMVVKVPEADIVKVRKGQSVEILTDVYRKYDVEIELPNDHQFPLKAGMYGSVKMQPSNGKVEQALFVPRNAVIGSVKDAQVYVLGKDETVSLRSVEVGEEKGDKVLILNGLSLG